MPKPPVLLNHPLPEYIEEQFTPHCELRPWSLLETGGPEELAAIQAMVIYGHTRVDDAVLEKVPNIKVISNFGVGYDHIDVAAAARHGVPVGNTPGTVDNATADLTMALLMAIARNVTIGDRYARSPAFTTFDPSMLIGHEVYGSTLGIIGMGRVGRAVAKRARGFDMRVLYCNRNRNPAAETELGVTFAPLDTLLAEAEFVTLNMPLTAETRLMIAEPQLRKMRSDAMLINIARGGVLDHDALYRALTEGWIAGAALDVTEPEPLPRDHPLLSLQDNLIITPHLGSATIRTRRRMGEVMVMNLRAGLAGEPLPFQVGP